MAFSRRWNPQPKQPQCVQCDKENRIPGRIDKLGAKCGKIADATAAKLAKHKREVAGDE